MSGNQYSWLGGITGSWGFAANWQDLTTGEDPASRPPGALDDVAISAGPGVTDVITGPGSAASLDISGSVSLSGTFDTSGVVQLEQSAALLVGTGSTLTVGGNLVDGYGAATNIIGGTVQVDHDLIYSSLYSSTVVSGTGSLTIVGNVDFETASAANSFTIGIGGTMAVDGNFIDSSSSLSVAGGNFTVGGIFTSRGTNLNVSNAGLVQLAGLNDSASGSGISLTVDGTSSVEIGAANTAKVGSVTVDAGVTVTEQGTITAPYIVDNGTIVVENGTALTLMTPSVLVGTGLSGQGAIDIGNNARLTIGAVDPGSLNTIVFGDRSAILSISQGSLNASGVFVPLVSKFASGDAIDYAGVVTGAAYSGTDLTLSNSGQTVAQLTLEDNNYAGDSFLVVPVSSGVPIFGNATEIVLIGPGDTPTAPGATATADQYAWAGGVSGSWDQPSNWQDLAGPASVSPGANDDVSIAAQPGTVDVITGIGNSASLTLSGSVLLYGTFATGAVQLDAGAALLAGSATKLTVSGNVAADSSASLSMTGGTATIGAGLSYAGAYGSTTVSGGALTVDGNLVYGYGMATTVTGGTMTVGGDLIYTSYYGSTNVSGTGSLTIGGNVSIALGNSFTIGGGGTLAVDHNFADNSSSFTISGGKFTVGGIFTSRATTFNLSNAGSVQLGGLNDAVTNGSTVSLTVDSTSSVEIGTTTGTIGPTTSTAAAGSVTVDAGVTVLEQGTITAPHIIDNGTIVVEDRGSLNLTSQFSFAGTGLGGTGEIDIGRLSGLTIGSVDAGSANTIRFAGFSGILNISPGSLTSAGLFVPTIDGFGSSDAIDYAGTVTDAAYSNGVLTLSDGVQPVARLNISGIYTGDTFLAVPLANNATEIVLVGPGDTDTPPPGTVAADQYAWIGGISGSWDLASNWQDLTTGETPASMPPGAQDNVSITALPGTVDVVTGTGNSASLTLSGGALLYGQFATGAVQLNGGAELRVGTGNALTVSGDVTGDASASLLVNGGTVAVGGDFNYSSSYGSTTVTGGSLTIAGVLNNGSAYSSTTVSGGNLTVDHNLVNGYGAAMSVTGGTMTVGGDLIYSSYYGGTNVSGTGLLTIDGNVDIALGNSFTIGGGGTLAVDTNFADNSSSFSVSGGKFTVGGIFTSRGTNFGVNNAGHVQLAGLNDAVTNGGPISLTVDGTSSFEIGTTTGTIGPTTGTAAAGSVTVDAFTVGTNTPVTVTEQGTITALAIVDNGTIAVEDGKALTLTAPNILGATGLTGTGDIDIGNNARLTIGPVDLGSANTIRFTGAAGILALSSGSLDAAGAFVPTIAGLASGDAIDYAGTVTDAAFAGDMTGGVLTLSDAGQTVATLNLAGDYTSDTFLAIAVSSNDTEIALGGVGDTETPPPGTTTPDQYAWIGGIVGSWDVASNWQDLTSGENPASLAPGINDQVTITAPGLPFTITGTGNSASLTLSGDILLKGHFAPGAVQLDGGAELRVGTSNELTVSGDVTGDTSASLLVNGGTVAVGGDFNYSSSSDAITVTGGSLSIAGTLDYSSAYSSTTVSGGALTVGGNLVYGYGMATTVTGGTMTVGGDLIYSSYYGGTTISGTGLLTIDGNVAIASGNSFTVGSGGTLTVDQNFADNFSSFSVSGGNFTVGGVFTSRGTTFNVSNAGHVQFAGLNDAMTNGGPISLAVDAISSFEIGTAGGVAAGAVTVDAGVATTEQGTITAPAIVDNGTIAVENGDALYLTTNGLTGTGLTGSGEVDIGNNARLTIGPVDPGSADKIKIQFTGTAGVLALSAGSLDITGALVPTIAGLASADAFEYAGTVTDASYVADAAHPTERGVLTLSDAGQTLATLTLAGNYPGGNFLAVPVPGDIPVLGAATEIVFLQPGDTPAPGGTITPDQYAWVGGISGSWDLASNWQDLTTGTPASLPPGVQNDVSITALPYTIDVITGAGDSHNLTLSGNTLLHGQFTAGAVQLAYNNVNGLGAALHVDAGNALTVSGDITGDYLASLLVNGGTVAVGGDFNYSSSSDSITVTGGKLTVTGALDYSSAYGSTTVSGGALTIGGNLVYGYGAVTNVTGGTMTVGGDLVYSSYYGSTNVSGTGLLTVDGNVDIALGNSFTIGGGGTLAVVHNFADASSSFSVSGGKFVVGGSFASRGTYFNVSNFGLVQLGGLNDAVTNGSAISLTVDGTSSFEIGMAGNAAAGAVTVDALVTVTEQGTITAPAIVDDGTIVVENGDALYLTTNGLAGTGLTGSGEVDIGNNARLTIGPVDPSSANTIRFTGAAGILALSAGSLDAGAFAPTIAGFAFGDAIDYAGPVTAVSYAGDAAHPTAGGVLTLSDAGQTVATLNLAGDYTGGHFVAVEVPGGIPVVGAASEIVLLQPGDTPAAPAGTVTADQYAWAGGISGTWDLASNWQDLTTQETPASVPPGAQDNVGIAALPGTVDVITGTGNAASLTLSGNVLLDGRFATEALHVQQSAALLLAAGDTLAASGNLTADSSAAIDLNGGNLTVDGFLIYDSSYGVTTVTGGNLTVGSGLVYGYGSVANISGGTVQVGGDLAYNSYYGSVNITGGLLNVAGNLVMNATSFMVGGSGTLAIANNVSDGNGGSSFSINGGTFRVGSFGDGTLFTKGTALAATNGGHVLIGSLVDGGNSSSNGVNLTVDATSVVEIGTAGTAALGTMTIDPGAFVAEQGSISAPNIVDNGTLIVDDGAALTLIDPLLYNPAIGSYVYFGTGLAGTGEVDIGNNARLTIGAVDPGSANTIAFDGLNGVLNISAVSLDASAVFDPQITEFATGDAIDYSGTVTDASYAASDVPDHGVLALSNAGQTVALLNLVGLYTGHSFVATPLGNDVTQITVSDLPPTGPGLTGVPKTLSLFEETPPFGLPKIQVQPVNPGDALTVTISGIPDDVQLSNTAGALTVTGGSIDLTPDQLAGLSLAAGEAETATLTMTATDTTLGESTIRSIALTVNPLPEAPSLSGTATALTLDEGAIAALPIVVTPHDSDDSVSITISGVSTDASLSAGTDNGDGSWTLTPAQLDGLMLSAGEDGAADLTVTATNTEAGGAAAVQLIHLTVDPVAEPPVLTIGTPAVEVVEGSAAPLGIAVVAGDADDTLSVIVAGVPSGASLSAGTDNGDGSWTLTPAQLDGLMLSAGTLSAAQQTSLTVTASASEGASSASAPSQTLSLTILDTTTLVVSEGLADDTGASSSDRITSDPALSGSGDPNALVHFTVDGSPIDATATANGAGTWSFTPSGLTDGSHLVVASETDLAGNSGAASLSFTLDTTAPVAPSQLAVLSPSDATNPVVTGIGEAGGSITLFDGDAEIGSGAVDGSGNWSITANTLTPGSHTVTATETDIAGNTSVGSAPLSLTIVSDFGTEATQLYLDVLDRDPNADELAFWTGQLAGGVSLADARTTLANTPEAQNDLGLLYQDELDRPPDPGGVAYFTNFLATGGKLHDLRTDFANSAEAQNDLGLLYSDELDRAPDPGGIAYFTNFLTIGGKLHDLRTDFANSAEAQTDLGLLYSDELDRAPDPGGVAYFTNFLVTGGKLHDLRTDFANSAEAQNDLALLYQDELDRAPDPGGVAYFTNFLINGGKLHDLRTDFANSAEAQTDLALLYEDELDRAPDPGGVAYFTNFLINGGKLHDLRTDFANSAEAQNDLALLYQNELGRAPDPGGIAYFTNFLIDGGKLHDLRTDIANSTEAQDDLAAIYQHELGRDPDAAGLAAFTQTLIDGTSLDQLRTVIAHSAEAQADLVAIFQSVIPGGRAPDQAELAGMENQLSPPILASQSDVAAALTANPNTPLGFTVVPGGSTADLVLTAPPGPAEFDFGGWVFGQDEIAGFDPTQDAIRLSTSLAGDFATLQAEMSTTAGGGTLITLNPSQSLTLDNAAPASLAAANFRFV